MEGSGVLDLEAVLRATVRSERGTGLANCTEAAAGPAGGSPELAAVPSSGFDSGRSSWSSFAEGCRLARAARQAVSAPAVVSETVGMWEGVGGPRHGGGAARGGQRPAPPGQKPPAMRIQDMDRIGRTG